MEMSFSAQEEAFAAARRAHFTELHCFVQTWILTFHDIGALNAQLDEAQTALGEVRSLKKLFEMEWAEYWGRSPRSLGPQRWNLPPARPSFAFLPRKARAPGDPAFQGEHNHTVFGELGLSECEIDGFIASGTL